MKKELSVLILMLIGLNAIGQINNGLIAKYYFNSGNANDESGNGYNADTVTAVSSVDRCGNTNHAFSFDGTQFINIPYIAPFNLNELSLSVWFKVLNIDSLNQRIIELPVGGISGDQHFSVMYNNPIEPKKIMTYFDPGPIYSAATDTVNDNQWHHYVGTISLSNQQVISFLDGLPVDTTSFISAPSSAGGYLQIGRFNNVYNQNFIGDIDDIRIYNRPLSALEVDSLFQEGCSTMGITSIENEKSISVFPNPSNGILNIQNNSNQLVFISLYNSLGDKIIDNAISNKISAIDISTCTKGIYFYHINTDNNLIKSGKLVVQ